MVMLLGGMVLVVGAIVMLYLGLVGVPEARISKRRLSTYATQDQASLLTRVTDRTISWVDSVLDRRGWRPFTALELELAGVRTPVASVVVFLISGAVITFAAVRLVLGSTVVALLAVVAVPLVSKAVLRWRVAARRRRFANQLHQALQMMAASLRAGHSLPRAMDAVSQDVDAPMSEEFARVGNEVRLGRDLVEALEQVSTRMESQDFGWVAGAIEAQRETGGNLNEILDQVAETIRERNHVRQQVHSLSAEGRMSAYVLMGLPVLLGLYFCLASPALMSGFVAAPIGKLLLVACAIAYTAGGFWMRSIVRIEF